MEIFQDTRVEQAYGSGRLLHLRIPGSRSFDFRLDYFLIQFRHGDPSIVGYVTAGFWTGITLGRTCSKFVLDHLAQILLGHSTVTFVAHKTGERLFVYITTAGVRPFPSPSLLLPPLFLPSSLSQTNTPHWH